MRARGISLIVVIIILLLLAVSVLGIVSFAFQGSRLSALRMMGESAYYRAQAGVNKAIREYQRNGSLTPETNSFFTVGTTSNYLLVEAADCKLKNGQRDLVDIRLRNVSGSENITVYRMIADWPAQTGARKLVSITLGGVRQSGSWSPGEVITLGSPPTISAGSTLDDNIWTFDNGVRSANTPMCVTFVLDNNASLDQAQKRKACVVSYDSADRKFYTGNNEFTITSTGKVGFGSGTMKRTVEATYDTDRGGGTITSWQESSSHL